MNIEKRFVKHGFILNIRFRVFQFDLHSFAHFGFIQRLEWPSSRFRAAWQLVNLEFDPLFLFIKANAQFFARIIGRKTKHLTRPHQVMGQKQVVEDDFVVEFEVSH
jgi:hypothetical protein